MIKRGFVSRLSPSVIVNGMTVFAGFNNIADCSSKTTESLFEKKFTHMS